MHPKFGTPYIFTADHRRRRRRHRRARRPETLVHLVSIGTLFAFVLVSVGVVILRRTAPRPAARRSGPRRSTSSRPLSVLLCVYLMLNLTGGTWVRFLVWMAIGLVVYFTYGAKHSRLGRAEYDKHAHPGPI